MTTEREAAREAWMAAVPVPAVASEAQEGRVVLLRPKFMSPRLAWLQRLLRKPCFRVKLDEAGSTLWRNLDGLRTVRELAELQRQALGERAEPAEDRALRFVQDLARGGFVTLQTRLPD